MNCWHCGHSMETPQWGKLPFRALCDKCGSSLHCCRNCINYKPGLPNDCKIPNTDFVSDRTATNFCEEFKLLGKKPETPRDPKEVGKKLFGDTDSDNRDGDPKGRFDSLFKND